MTFAFSRDPHARAAGNWCKCTVGSTFCKIASDCGHPTYHSSLIGKVVCSVVGNTSEGGPASRSSNPVDRIAVQPQDTCTLRDAQSFRDGDNCRCQPGFVSTDGNPKYTLFMIGTFSCSEQINGDGASIADGIDTTKENEVSMHAIHVHSHHKAGSKAARYPYSYTLDGNHRYCGSEWLREMKGVELEVPIVAKWSERHALLSELTGTPVRSGERGRVQDELDIRINNRGKGGLNGCNPNDLAMWISVEGPESMAMMAVPDTDGKCSWTAHFEFTRPGEYKLLMQLLFWGGKHDFDSSPCGRSEKGEVWAYSEQQELGVRAADDAKSLLPQYTFWQGHPSDKKEHCSICQHRCDTEPGCTHFYTSWDAILVPNEAVQPPVGKANIKCVLLSNATGLVQQRVPSPLKRAVAGVRSKQPTHFYLGNLYGVMSMNGLYPRSSETSAQVCGKAHPGATSVVRDKPTVLFTVTLSAAKSKQTASGGVRGVDHAALNGQPLGDRGSTRLCQMGGVTRLPHRGRWLNVSEELRSRGKESPSGGMYNRYCYPPTEHQTRPANVPYWTRMNKSAPPFDFIGYVMGSPENSQGAEYAMDRMNGVVPYYYWQPYECDYHHFATSELRSCLIKKGLTRFIVHGDSLMTGGGTGWATTFRELLGNIGNTTSFPVSGIFPTGYPADDDFQFAAFGSDQFHNLWSDQTQRGFKYGPRLSDRFPDKFKATELDEKRKSLIVPTALQKVLEQFSWAGGTCPDVIVLNFWLNHKMMHMNSTDLATSLTQEVDRTEQLYVVGGSFLCTRLILRVFFLPACFPAMFFYSPPPPDPCI